MTCVSMWWISWAKRGASRGAKRGAKRGANRGACSWWIKRASSRKGRTRPGWRANRAGRQDGGRISKSASFWRLQVSRGAPSSSASCRYPKRGCATRGDARQEGMRDPPRCREAGIPATQAFATKPPLARQLLTRAFAAGGRAHWVAGDGIYGAEEVRRWLESEGRADVLALPWRHAIWEQGEPVWVATLVERHPDLGGVRLSAGCVSRRATAAKGLVATIGRGCACPPRVRLAWRPGCSCGVH
jgi:hypothetical protein